MVNSVNRNLIFTWKLLCVAMSIGSGYAAIAHFKDHPVFGAMYYMLFLDCAIFYCVMYGKAFKIPAQIEDVKTVLLLHGRSRGVTDWRKKLMLRQVRAILPLGIKVGGFHSMERTSTPVFLHYVLANVVSMLVAYN